MGKCGFTHASRAEIRIFTPRDIKFRTILVMYYCSHVRYLKLIELLIRIHSPFSNVKKQGPMEDESEKSLRCMQHRCEEWEAHAPKIYRVRSALISIQGPPQSHGFI